jgi:hypothetical protein
MSRPFPAFGFSRPPSRVPSYFMESGKEASAKANRSQALPRHFGQVPSFPSGGL